MHSNDLEEGVTDVYMRTGGGATDLRPPHLLRISQQVGAGPHWTTSFLLIFASTLNLARPPF